MALITTFSITKEVMYKKVESLLLKTVEISRVKETHLSEERGKWLAHLPE